MFVVATRNFPPDIGGIQILIEGLAKSLVNHGPIKIFADEYPDCKQYDSELNIEIKRVGGFKVFRKYRKAKLINDYLKENNIRAIFFDHWKSLEHIDTQVLNKINSFCLIHGKEINHPKESMLNKRMNKSLLKTKFIIANSHYTKNLAINVGIDADKINIINPGTEYPINIGSEHKKRAKDIFSSSFPKIITVARLDRRKSHRNILMTIKNLKPIYPNIKYVCVGGGEEKTNLESLKKELNLDREVILLENIEEQLKVALLNESDLFLMPSVVYKKSVEGFGISFIEAASYGKGSIGGKAGGAADAIIQSETGYLCNGEDLSSIYEAIINFFHDNNYKVLGKQAKIFWENFKWKNIIKKYFDLI